MALSTIVKTKNGPVEGLQSKSSSGLPFLSFRGIPYAEPPIGHHRFSKPVPPRSWSEIRPAKRYGPDCIQLDMVTRSFIGSEDCLYLNIFTRAKIPDSGYPVLVWIHGGAFNFGSGSGSLYGPDRAMDEDIVLVTINYRIGPIGFLASNDGEFPANLGLWDQSMALNWIRNNVQFFGGDRKKMTVFGESAGAASIHLHTLSPASNGLFDKAVMQSGTALCPWALNRDPDGSLMELAQHLKLSKGLSKAELKSRLMTIPAEAIVKAAAKVVNAFGVPKFLPVVETCGDVSNRFIPDDPCKLIQSGGSNNVPMIIGFNAHEAAFTAPALMTSLVAGKIRFGDLFQVGGRKHEETLQNLNRIRNRFFGGRPIDPDSIRTFAAALSDEMFVAPIVKSVEIYRKLARQNVFVYRFSHRGRNSLTDLFGHGEPDLGVSHFDEVILQFQSKVFPPLEIGSLDEFVSKLLWKILSEFSASNQRPMVGEISWPDPFESTKSGEVLGVDISRNPSVQNLTKNFNFEFWESVKSKL